MFWRKKTNPGPVSGREGMSAVELMLGLVITAILAAVAIPTYMTYIQQARVFSLVLPPLHLLESNVAMHYMFNKKLPGAEEQDEIIAEIDTSGLTVELLSGVIVLRIAAPEPEAKLHILHNNTLIAAPDITRDKITAWHLSGALADRLSLSN